MGPVTATITVTNEVDKMLAKRGFIPADQIRCITIDNVLVDTGATRLCLPADIIAQSAFPSLQQRGQRTLLPIARC
ncbi:hypothetical protein Q5692_03190 [Microcoleus sp. C2C3]|uniref:hypothetical protein n=1 Tax=unclassified Microcoleus TaxID=2642155 RepID=UPI002FD50351